MIPVFKRKRDVAWWCNSMDMLSSLLALCEGVDSPCKSDEELWCFCCSCWTNSWAVSHWRQNDAHVTSLQWRDGQHCYPYSCLSMTNFLIRMLFLTSVLSLLGWYPYLRKRVSMCLTQVVIHLLIVVHVVAHRLPIDIPHTIMYKPGEGNLL